MSDRIRRWLAITSTWGELGTAFCFGAMFGMGVTVVVLGLTALGFGAVWVKS